MAMTTTLLLIISLFAVTNASPLVDSVCGQTRNPGLCKTSLAPDSRTEKADLPLLAYIAVSFAGVRANAIKQENDALKARETNPTIKDKYVKCENLYYDVLDELFVAAFAQIKSKQWGPLSELGRRVSAQVDACDAVFNNNSPYRSQSQVVDVLADVIAVAAKRL